MAISTFEQETVINFGRTDDRASVYTSDSRYITKCDKLCEGGIWKLEEEIKLNGEIIGKRYSCPVNMISFRGKKREMSEERKQESAKRFKKMWEEKRSEDV